MFCFATVPSPRLLHLQFFDKDGSGYITIDELQTALKDHGNAAEVAAHIQDILKDVDKDSDGRIDYEVGGAWQMVVRLVRNSWASVAILQPAAHRCW